jgi:hypothetical protein
LPRQARRSEESLFMTIACDARAAIKLRLLNNLLGWRNWHNLSKEAHSQLEPLFQEATKRFFQPLLGMMPVQSASSAL